MYTTAMFRRDTRGRPRLVVALALIALSATALDAQRAVSVSLEPSLSARTDGERIEATAAEAAARYLEWLGAPRFARLHIIDRSSDASDETAIDESVATVPVTRPWPAPALAMTLESRVASAVAAAWLSGLPASGTAPYRQGLAWYLQSHIVERLFNLRAGAAGYRVELVPLFGGRVPWPLPRVRRSRWSAGLGRDLLLHPAAGTMPRPAATPLGVPAARLALAFGTLERWLGWPVLQGGLRALSEESQRRGLDEREVVGVLSAAIGQDLSWLFSQALDPAATFDVAVAGVSIAAVENCAPPSCYRTEVALERRGRARFGPDRGIGDAFSASSGLEVRLRFADGQSASARWDGREERSRVVFESAAPVDRVWLDPDRVLLLDRDPLDQDWSPSPSTNVPVTKWLGRWLVWLQDAALTYMALL